MMNYKSCYFSLQHKPNQQCSNCHQMRLEILYEAGKGALKGKLPSEDPATELASKYPKYWKPLPANWRAIDTYRINSLFPISTDDDASGMVLHARKKLLVPGTRTGGKSFYNDIKEARDTLTGWLEEHKEKADG